DDAECAGKGADDGTDLRVLVNRQGRGGQHAGRVAGVDPGLLDVLHHRADVGVLAVGDGVDVDLDCALEETVDQHRPVDLTEVVGRVAHAHRTSAQHVGGADQDGKPDALGDGPRFRR